MKTKSRTLKMFQFFFFLHFKNFQIENHFTDNDACIPRACLYTVAHIGCNSNPNSKDRFKVVIHISTFNTFYKRNIRIKNDFIRIRIKNREIDAKTLFNCDYEVSFKIPYLLL